MSLRELAKDAVGEPERYLGSARALLDAEPGRRVDREEELDRAVIAWAARFAFVTISTLAARWGVSEQRVRARVRRLERAGYLRRVRQGSNHPARIVVTERGGDLCGLAIRTAHGREPLGHELAVIKRVMAIEQHFVERGPGGGRVLTERDMRRDERRDTARKWAVDVVHPHGRRGKRWPDYAIQSPDGSTAVELEFSLKAAGRLRSIIRGYEDTSLYDYVDFVLLQRRQDAELWRWLTRLVDEAETLRLAARLPWMRTSGPKLRLVPWRDPLPELHAGISPFPAVERASA